MIILSKRKLLGSVFALVFLSSLIKLPGGVKEEDPVLKVFLIYENMRYYTFLYTLPNFRVYINTRPILFTYFVYE